VADYLRTRDLNALRRDAEDMARRHPALLFGGLFLTGLVLGNLVKASRRKMDQPREDATGIENGGNEYSSSGYSDLGSAGTSGYTDTQRSAGGI
jgi:hypothetical protein